MDKKEAIKYLKERSKEILHLASLPYKNQEYPLWCNQISDVLEEIFGRDTTEYERFSRAFLNVHVFDKEQEEYLEELKLREAALLSIIKKYELLGIEAKPTVKTEIPIDTTELPVYLFDKMQLHPRVIEVSESLFKTGNYANAIFEAFEVVNNFVKERTGLSLDGKALMSKVFNENAPIIRLNELLTQSDCDEQEGFKFLFMGAMVGIRNPKAHDNVVQTDPYRTLEYLSFASLLMKRVKEGKVVRTQKHV